MNCACPDIRHPDLCVFLDLTPEASLARISARGEAREVFETVETLTRVRNTFLSVFAYFRFQAFSPQEARLEF